MSELDEFLASTINRQIKVASQFSEFTEYNFELVAAGASGDLAYTVGYEHSVRVCEWWSGRTSYFACNPHLPKRER